ncbi:MAG: hypothetical protein ABJB86_23305 [Bacteroidota bacterium]
MELYCEFLPEKGQLQIQEYQTEQTLVKNEFRKLVVADRTKQMIRLPVTIINYLTGNNNTDGN